MARAGLLAVVGVLAMAVACADDESEIPGAPTLAADAPALAASTDAPVFRPTPAPQGEGLAIDGAKLSAPAPVTPANGVTIDGLRPTFRVNNPSMTGIGGSVFIELQIARNRGFNPVDVTVIETARARGNTDLRPPRDLNAGTTYYWRARGMGDSRTSAWSAVRSFRTGAAGDAPGASPNAPFGPGGDPPNMRHVVEAVAAENPSALLDSCRHQGGSWLFLDLVVERLRKQNGRWAYHCERGDCNSIGPDTVSFYRGLATTRAQAQGSSDVAIIDVIDGHCSRPRPGWTDKTWTTNSNGSTARWTYPRPRTTTGGTPDPTPTDPPDTDHPHLHEGLDGHFHRTLIYGDGFGYRNPDTGDFDVDCENGETVIFVGGQEGRCIDHRFWRSHVQSAPERLRVVVDDTAVYRQDGERADGWERFTPDTRCRVSDLRTPDRRRFVRDFTIDTRRAIEEATGRGWQGSIEYRAPGAYRHPETVVVRFVIDGCGGRDGVAGCATYGAGGYIVIVIDDRCETDAYDLLSMRELWVHELGHTLGFRHPDTRDPRDEMGATEDNYDRHAGFSAREIRHMRHAYAHGPGYRGAGGLHVEGPRRPRRLEWVID